ncbi:uncharacterized protein CCR75_005185 [Bremia lactucae]|uniref:U6 snRNA-associated Sm-like protein LSm1 n=1 Tax=Bremia lactucae TaxID=4779 RepID=A0A976FHI0_BRELC|nr:hypothetical protein CCR75_005185 [Bremia lactucae]
MNGIFPGNSSLVQQLDSAFLQSFLLLPSFQCISSTEQVLMVLRDGRHLVGYLRSFDQFSNIILENTFERHVAGKIFCDIELGLNIIRILRSYSTDCFNSGDNIVLLGELDSDKERDQPHMNRVELEEVLEAEERLNKEGNTSVRQQWDFDQQH